MKNKDFGLKFWISSIVIITFVILILASVAETDRAVSYSTAETASIILENVPDSHHSILLGSEVLSFGGLEYSGSSSDGYLDVSSKDFYNSLYFRGEKYKLSYGESFEGDFFKITYIPSGRVSLKRGVRPQDYWDRIILEIEPEGIELNVDNVVTKSLNDPIKFDIILNNQLFDGLKISLESKTSDLLLFSQKVRSADFEARLGTDNYELVVPNNFLGRKEITFSTAMLFEDKTVVFDSDVLLVFDTGRNGFTDLNTEESFGLLVDGGEVVSSVVSVDRTVYEFLWVAFLIIIMVVILLVVWSIKEKGGRR